MRETAMPESDAIYDLWELRGNALQTLSSAVVPIAYIWECWLLFDLQRFTWQLLGPFVLGLGATVGYLFGRRRPRLVAPFFIACLAVMGVAVGWTSGVRLTSYLTIPAIVCAGVLLSPTLMFVVAALLGLALVSTAVIHWGYAPISLELAHLLAMMAVTAVACWLSARTLYAALEWATESYSRACEEMLRARSQRAQLRQALKSMDEASGRLQWMNYELAHARDEAEELRRLKQQFVANVSHELRTPLALIAGFSEMMYLSQGSYGVPLPLDYVGDVREIYRNSQHLLSLIDDVLDLSRITSGKMLLARQEVDPGGTIREAVDTIRPLIEGKGLTLDLEIETPLPTVYMDAGRVRQVLLNLLNNARRFTERGEIRVQARREGDDLQVSVSDTGVGIPPAAQPKLFEEFRQLDGSLTREHDGAGLGLAISKEFVELHGGRIWVESEGVSGRGSTFHFTLPISDGEGDAQVGHALLRGRPVSWSQPVPTLLVASDDASVVHLLERNLDGYRVAHVEALSQLPELAVRFCPRALLLTGNPGREMEQIAQARASLGDTEIPIIVCPLGGEEHLARALGVRAYLVKPVERRALLATLGSLGQQMRRVLIVDDDPRFVRLVSRIIRSADRPYEIVRAYSAPDALARLRDGGADAILLDLLMPDMDGRTFLDAVRREGFGSIPVVVVTSKVYDTDDAQQWGSKLFAVAYGRGVSNEEAVGHLKGMLDVLAQTARPQAGPGA